MRVGRNPLTGQTVTAMPELVGFVITHLPHQRGYHAARLEIIQTCLETMRAGAGRALPMCVWDNGSCDELRDWLQDEFRPEYLVLSPNVGKASARTAATRMFPPETVVCVSDDDMLYYPGWLEPQLELLRAFPNVGVVSGYPVRTQFRWGNVSTLAWARENAVVKVGRFISEQHDRDFCASIGRDYEMFHVKRSQKDQETLIEWKGLQAYATAHHCQFIAVCGRIEFIVQWDQEAISDERNFDRAIDEQGLLRLTTVARLVRHIGNVLDADLRAEIDKVKWQTTTPA